MGRAVARLFAAAAIGAVTISGASTAPAEETVRFRLVGFGTPLPTQIGSGRCPEGRTALTIASASGTRIGKALVCVLTIRKTDLPNYGVRRIVQAVLETDSLPGGTIVSRQRQSFLFARDQRHTTATFRGRVMRGTGRYVHATGTVSGGGPGVDGKARWAVRIRLR